MWYNIALFLHIIGAIGTFIAVSLIITAFVRMRRAATLAAIREWAGVAVGAGKSLALLSLILLAPAIYMVIVAWGFTTPWVLGALIAFVLLAVLGATSNGQQIERIFAATQVDELAGVPATLRAQLTAPQLWMAEGIRFALLVGIVFLMAVKPDVLPTLIVLLLSLVLGILAGVVTNAHLRKAEAR
jgi:hypothetical protein